MLTSNELGVNGAHLTMKFHRLARISPDKGSVQYGTKRASCRVRILRCEGSQQMAFGLILRLASEVKYYAACKSVSPAKY
jgi:hypothetical protein